MGLLIARAAAGSLVGLVTFLAFLEARVDAWVPLSAGALVASAGITVVHIGLRSSHYTARATRDVDRPRGVAAYMLTQTLMGLPVVAIAAVLAWGAAFGVLIAP